MTYNVLDPETGAVVATFDTALTCDTGTCGSCDSCEFSKAARAGYVLRRVPEPEETP